MSTIHLTRRGRLVLLVALVGLVFAAFSLGRVGSQASTDRTAALALHTATVQQGETLWSLAQRVAPRNDPRDVISAIEHLNHLSDAAVQTGQLLLLPA